MLRHLVAALLFLGLLAPDSGYLEAQTKLGTKSIVAGQPYERYSTRDVLGRDIVFYLSESYSNKDSLPLVVYVQGSGCGSVFRRRGGKVVPTGGHISLQEVAKENARVLIVEKPGVKFLDEPLRCEAASEFNLEHTLERWVQAIEAAILAARSFPLVGTDKMLVIGHSEGGLVACRIARDMPDIVSHVASLAGGGPSQLFDLLTLSSKGTFFGDVSGEPAERVMYVLNQWKKVQANPTSAKDFFFGFVYRRWSTFLTSSPMDELRHVEARIYLAQGLDDESVDPAGSDMLRAQLISQGKSVVYDRVEGADHSFNIKGNPDGSGWQEQLKRIIHWFRNS
jgi:pimeloyl-ACP methyl ester carboxylesterase